jgi:hypothetical protein
MRLNSTQVETGAVFHPVAGRSLDRLASHELLSGHRDPAKRGHTHAGHVEYQPNFVHFGTGSINITTVCGYERAECMRLFK